MIAKYKKIALLIFLLVAEFQSILKHLNKKELKQTAMIQLNVDRIKKMVQQLYARAGTMKYALLMLNAILPI